MTLTPPGNEKGSIARYTQAEKDILFDLFKEYEEIIDIKYRKKSRRKTLEVRQCWQEILDAYNNDPQITTRRNLKQLQKFWLNARLRKRYPLSHDESSSGNQISVKQVFQPLKSENSIMEIGSSSPQYQQDDEQHPVTRKSNEKRIKYEIQLLNTSNEITGKDQSNNDTRQISIETISNDNLSLNDLLEFKNSRQNSQVLEIKSVQHSSSPASHRNRYHSIDDENAGSATIIYTNAASGDDYESEHIHEKTVLIDQVKKPQERTLQLPANSSTQTTCTCLDDPFRPIRIMEAELKLKEQEFRTEKQKVELAKTEEELRHMKQMNELAVQEMRIKVKMLENSVNREKE